MIMPRLLAASALALGLFAAAPAHAERPVITTTSSAVRTEAGAETIELTVVVHGATDYCASNAKTDIVRKGDSIRIVRDRPTSVSRCVSQRDLTFVVKDVPAGTYAISYEQIPMLAPARFLVLATATVNVR